jgi:fructose-1,6-bisphosphatase I
MMRGDIMPQFLDHLPDATAPDLTDTLDRLAGFGAALARRIARGGLDEALGTAQGSNADGDTQKALDVIADDMTRAALAGGAVRYYASEEQQEVMTLGAGNLALVIDPLDGSSNIDTNVSVGTIFGLYPARGQRAAPLARIAGCGLHDLWAAMLPCSAGGRGRRREIRARSRNRAVPLSG